MNQLFLRFILFVLSCIILPDTSLGQKLDHELGEFLIELPTGLSLDKADLKSWLAERNILSVTQILSEPKNIFLLKTDHAKVNELTLLARLKNESPYIAVQQNKIIERRNTPNDNLFLSQWHYINNGNIEGHLGADLDADLGWDITTGGTTANGDEIVACIIDDGMDGTHQDLIPNLWQNLAEIPNNGIDDDGNGYIDDRLGWNDDEQNDNIFNQQTHGVPVAGIVGAKGNNSIGVAGHNWDIKLMIVVGGRNEASAISSYGYPYKLRKMYNESNGQEGAFVVVTNSSWGISRVMADDAPIWCDFYNTLGAAGIINCGATTNRDINVDLEGDLPTSCPSEYLIGVTNINSSDQKPTGAGYGTESIDIASYGDGVFQTIQSNDYGIFGGTSAACPQVTGLVALAYAVDCEQIATQALTHPAETALLIKDMVLAGGKKVPSLDGLTAQGTKQNNFNTLRIAQDYCSACPGIFKIETTVANLNSLSLEINNRSEVDNYTLRFRPVNSSSWSIQNFSGSMILLSGLSACVEYEVQFKPNCTSINSDFGQSFFVFTDGCCNAPEPIELTDGSIGWNNITAAQNYTLEYRSAGQSTWSEVQLGTGELYDVQAAQECYAVEIRMRSNCSSQSSEYSEVITAYGDCGSCVLDHICTPPIKDNEFEWIANVSLNGLSQASGSNESGYGNFIGQTIFTVERNSSYEMSITPGFGGSVVAENYAVWIDLNGNGSFENSEKLFDVSNSSELEVKSNIEIPPTTDLGITRMRVVMSFNRTARACEAQEGFGEVEDYCILIEQSTATNDLELGSHFGFVPNPFGSFLTIETDLNQTHSLTIFDMNGRQKYHQLINQSPTIRLETTDWPSGFYFAKIRSGTQIYTQKLIKID